MKWCKKTLSFQIGRAQLASTLEHIVGQLDILTQVKSKSVTCMIVYIMYAHLWAIFVCNCYC